MRKPVLFAAGCSLWLVALLLACRGKGAPRAESHTPPADSTAAPLPALDDVSPAMDLLASRALWHLHRKGLLIPFASEGFLKYTQAYNKPWRDISTLENRPGRALAGTAATLRFPWDGRSGPATVVVRLHGGSAGKKLTVRLNGRPLKNAALENGWQQLALPVPADRLVDGENVLALAVAKRGAFFHSIEIVPGETPPALDSAWPPASPVAKVAVAGKQREGLTGFARLWLPLEIPDEGWLVMDSAVLAGSAQLRVSITVEGQPRQTLLDERQDAGVRPRRIRLGPFSGKLAMLELSVHEGKPADVAWLSPRILLPKMAQRPRPKPAKNFILLVADALRADKLPMYAASRVRVPNIAKAARERGVTFTSTQAASPSSPPSHASIQSGCFPRKHDVLGDKSKVNPDAPMVASILAKAGIATMFVGDAGFAMNRLKPVSKWDEFHMPGREGKPSDCSSVVSQILEFADKQAGKRFFASGVAFEPHTAYFYHQGITEHYYDGPFDKEIGKRPDGVQLTAIVRGKLKMTPDRWAQLKGLYDGEVEYFDGCFGTLLDGLKTRGLADNTSIVLLSDHGEGFFEHGSMGHAYGQYAELTNVPLVWFLPGIGHGQKIATVVSHVDVVPTIVDMMGIAPDPRVQGESLLPMMLREGAWPPRVEPSEYGRSYSLRSRALHYLVDYGGKESLFDLSTDPAEKSDVKGARPLALRYFRDLAGIYLVHRADWRTRTWGTLNNHRSGFAAKEIAAQQ